jgi:hypothetical protein
VVGEGTGEEHPAAVPDEPDGFLPIGVLQALEDTPKVGPALDVPSYGMAECPRGEHLCLQLG